MPVSLGGPPDPPGCAIHNHGPKLGESMSGSSNGEPPDRRSVPNQTKVDGPSQSESLTGSTLNADEQALDSELNLRAHRIGQFAQPPERTVAGVGSLNATQPPATQVTDTKDREDAQSALLEVRESPRHSRVRNMSTPRKDERSSIRARLVIVSEIDRDNFVYLDGPLMTLGRGRDTDIMVLDEGVSRVHARLVRHSEGFRLVDSGSGNGTYLNGRSIKEAELYDGDVIGLGQTRLEYEGMGWKRRLVDRPSVVQAVFNPTQSNGLKQPALWLNVVAASLSAFIVVATVNALRGPSTTDPMASALQWHQRAKTSATKSRWRAARDEVEIAKVLGLNQTRYQSLLSRIEAHMVDDELVHIIESSIAAGQPLATIKTLAGRLTPGSPKSGLVGEMVTKEVTERTGRWLRDARRAHMASDRDQALAHLEKIMDVRPNHADAAELLSKLTPPSSPTLPARQEAPKPRR